MLELSFPSQKLISTNEANQLHWAVRRKRLEPWRDETMVAWWRKKQSPEAKAIVGRKCEVQFVIGVPDNRRRDPANYISTIVKACVDTLVSAGKVWPDDDPRYVRILEPVLHKGTECVIRITPVEDE